MQPEDPEDVIATVGRRIAELRARSGRTQAEVAEALGTTVPNLQRIEHGQQNVTIRTMVRIANVIGARVAEFFQEPETPTPEAPQRKRGRPRKRSVAG
ncbi:helix-turn-helix domain-containing protein [Sorangium sp. So ce1000]|uniref:helix-turn-helix domain-containing protein n=1 Tax=Sorangium sp. So ce1000 TaxID=3133325 RepID=UPI003F6478F1